MYYYLLQVIIKKLKKFKTKYKILVLEYVNYKGRIANFIPINA